MNDQTPEEQARSLAAAQMALRLVPLALPHLAGLAAAVRLELDRRVPTMGVFASGRILVNPDFLATLRPREAMFVLAHELMHLALRTHDRQQGSNPELVNFAHDYIINDMLMHDLGEPIPAGGLYWEGARQRSLESLVADLRQYPQQHPPSGWCGQPTPAPAPPKKKEKKKPPPSTLGTLLREAMARAGLKPPPEPEPEPEPAEPAPAPVSWPAGDALDEAQEREWFPEAAKTEIQQQTQKITELAAEADSLGAVIDALANALGTGHGVGGGSQECMVTALRGLYAPPWEVALQRWLEAVAPGSRTFARPSRRGADRTDLVLPGRKREGWMLHIVLDTSGSMTGEIPLALGAIADFCEGVGVEQVHLLQCDVAVTQDEFVDVGELTNFRVSGYGGSDMSPALNRLADDLEVAAVIVLTDGDIAYPPELPPYDVLWVLPSSRSSEWFQPPYGNVISMSPGQAEELAYE